MSTNNTNTEKKKHAGGRPPKFNTPKELELLVNEYFAKFSGLTILRNSNEEIVLDKQGKPIFEIKPPTISGLAYYLGFLDRQSIYDYSNRDDEFSCILKKAKLRIIDFSEQMLYSGKPVGAIFALKNAKAGFEDAVKVNTETQTSQIDVTKLTNDDLIYISNAINRVTKPIDILEVVKNEK